MGSTAGKDFVSDLSSKIGKPIINLGISGETSRQGLLRIDKVTREDPGTVIILFGGNDYLKKVPQDETFKNLRQIISEFQSRGSMVVLLGIRGGMLTDKFYSSFKKLADEMGVIYAPDVLSGLITNSKYMSDPVHPNDLGYEKISERVYATMKDYLK